MLADKAYDSNALRSLIASIGAEAVIPSNGCRKVAIPHDRTTYKHRNRIERCFNKLKHFRRFATLGDQAEPEAVRRAVAATLDSRFGIEHCTIQTEAAGEACEDAEHLHP